MIFELARQRYMIGQAHRPIINHSVAESQHKSTASGTSHTPPNKNPDRDVDPSFFYANSTQVRAYRVPLSRSTNLVRTTAHLPFFVHLLFTFHLICFNQNTLLLETILNFFIPFFKIYSYEMKVEFCRLVLKRWLKCEGPVVILNFIVHLGSAISEKI